MYPCVLADVPGQPVLRVMRRKCSRPRKVVLFCGRNESLPGYPRANEWAWLKDGGLVVGQTSMNTFSINIYDREISGDYQCSAHSKLGVSKYSKILHVSMTCK